MAVMTKRLLVAPASAIIAIAKTDRLIPASLPRWRGIVTREMRLLGVLCGFVLCGLSVSAHDWPQFLGPQRNGVYSGPPLETTWPAGGPKKVWQKPVGTGFAGPIVAGDRLILFHRVNDEEVVDALDAKTGAPRWHYAYKTAYRDDFGFDEGPRAVPVVAQNRVYTFGAEGQLRAVDLATGKEVWAVDTMRRFHVRKGYFGAAGSPLVEDGRVIANVGGDNNSGIVAFNAQTGAVLWTATNHEASYSSPISATFGGRKAAVFFTRQGLAALDPATGAVRFQKSWRSRSQASVNAATPIVTGDLIFVSATYETGAALLRVKDDALSDVWSSDEAMSNHYATSVVHNGVLYGFHGRQRQGALERGQVPRGYGDAGRRHPGHPARDRRARAGAGVAAGLPSGRPRPDPAADAARLSRHRRRIPLRAQQRHRRPRCARLLRSPCEKLTSSLT
jgi:outer membrane protein assembly factor BamB